MPAAASADTYCVSKPGCAPDHTFTVVQAGLNAAETNSGDDRVEIGSGTFTGTANPNAAFTYTGAAGSNDVTIVGAGQGQTILRGPASVDTVYTVLFASGITSISHLTVLRPAGAGANRIGIDYRGTADHVTVADIDPAHPSPGHGVVLELSTVLRNSDISVGGNDGNIAVGVSSQSTTIEDSSLRGFIVVDVNINSDNTIRRSVLRVTGSLAGLAGGVRASGCLDCRIEDSIVLLTAPQEEGIVTVSDGNDSQMTARHVTVEGNGAAGQQGVEARAETSGHTAYANITGSIIRGVGVSTNASANVGMSASVTHTYTDYDPSRATSSGAGLLVPPDPRDFNAVNPRFVNEAG